MILHIAQIYYYILINSCRFPLFSIAVSAIMTTSLYSVSITCGNPNGNINMTLYFIQCYAFRISRLVTSLCEFKNLELSDLHKKDTGCKRAKNENRITLWIK